ncbi:MAG: DUF3482 domain-containing protein [Verrucomicrobiae bacterium]|nr:DUF3482 domain-containing protein [Verrucomicrobiae bacterium]NNJ42788.1 DUF3482 domain-containing protein [Akkermansiaceae bacterium]
MSDPKSETDVPTFAVVGKVNMGKSSVLATLLEVDDDRVIRISPTPGETTRCQILPLEFDGQERIRFIDTPGFSRPIEAMREIQRMAGHSPPGLDAVKTFVEENKNSSEFDDECQLLAPLIDGAGLLYIIDPSKPLRDEFIAEMEILRWTGRRRMAVLNAKGDASDHERAWKDRLGSYFNLVRTFNAHHARFDERRRLLKSLLEIDEEHAGVIESTIRFIDDEWRQRREESAEVVVDVLEKVMLLREFRILDEHDLEVEHRRERVKDEMVTAYYQRVTTIVKQGVDCLLKIYRHHLVQVDWEEFGFENIDLEAAETWSKWGLSRSQLALAGGAAGAAAGVAVDVGTGGLTHGAGTLVGSIAGAAAAFFKGNELPDLKVDIRGGVKLQSGEGRKWELGPPKNENFPWIVLDRLLVTFREIQNRAHGRRDPQLLSGGEGMVKRMDAEQRRTLGKWLNSCSQGEPDRGMEPDVYRLCVATLEEVEQGEEVKQGE